MPHALSSWPTRRGGLLALCLLAVLGLGGGCAGGHAAAERGSVAKVPQNQLVTFTIRAEALPQASRLVSVQATEKLSQPYELAVGLWVAEPGFDAARALRTRATVGWHHARQQDAQLYHGIWVSLEYLYERDGESLYRGILVPRLYELAFQRRFRTFLDKTVPEVVSIVLEANGFGADDFELRLASTYPSVEQLSQHDESDLAFISRSLERVGMYFYFAQGERQDKLIISDHLSAHQASPLAPVPFEQVGPDGAGAELALRVFSRRHAAGPAAVRLLDYDHQQPTTRLSETAVVDPEGIGTTTIHGELVPTRETGSTLARRHAERLAAGRVPYRGQGRALGLRAGHVFELSGHPRADFNQSYLCTEVRHLGLWPGAAPHTRELLGIDMDEDYQVSLEAITADVQYRP